MTNDIVKIKSVAASQGGETEHGLMLDSSILSYTYQGSSKTVKWILDTIFTLLGGKASSSTTLAGYGITDAYTKTQVDTYLNGKANLSGAIFTGEIQCQNMSTHSISPRDNDLSLSLEGDVETTYPLIRLQKDGKIALLGSEITTDSDLVDTTPTANSKKLITSGAVASALSVLSSKVGYSDYDNSESINLDNEFSGNILSKIIRLKYQGADDTPLSNILTSESGDISYSVPTSQIPVLSYDSVTWLLVLKVNDINYEVIILGNM